MKHSRNNFVEFNNPDLREEGRRALDRRKRRRKRIRNFSVITFICAVIVIVSVFLFPQQFSTFSLSSIFNNISTLLPKNTSDTAVSKNIKLWVAVEGQINGIIEASLKRFVGLVIGRRSRSRGSETFWKSPDFKVIVLAKSVFLIKIWN